MFCALLSWRAREPKKGCVKEHAQRSTSSWSSVISRRWRRQRSPMMLAGLISSQASNLCKQLTRYMQKHDTKKQPRHADMLLFYSQQWFLHVTAASLLFTGSHSFQVDIPCQYIRPGPSFVCTSQAGRVSCRSCRQKCPELSHGCYDHVRKMLVHAVLTRSHFQHAGSGQLGSGLHWHS